MEDLSNNGIAALSTEPDRALVTAARCADYELEVVRAALREVLAPLGGMAAFVKPGERIALKPNLLMPADPEKAIATHPVVVAAVALEVMEAGAHPVVVESPGISVMHVKSVMERVFRKTGYTEMAERHGFELSLDMEYETVSCPDAVLFQALRSDDPHPAGRRRHQPGQVQDAHVHDLHRGHQEPVRGDPRAQQGLLPRPAGRSPSASPTCCWTSPTWCGPG